MARPKKPPRVRLQIVMEREQAKRLRKFCRERDLEISHVVRFAVTRDLDNREAAEWQARNGLDS